MTSVKYPTLRRCAQPHTSFNLESDVHDKTQFQCTTTGNEIPWNVCNKYHNSLVSFTNVNFKIIMMVIDIIKAVE